jgi:N-dimethylarginine dimethylaminohydrolase
MNNETVSKHVSAWQEAKTIDECEEIINANSKAMDLWIEDHHPVIIMCEPKYYSVDKGSHHNGEVAGNAFLKKGYDDYHKDSARNHQIMQHEWQCFRDLLQLKGAKILLIPPHDKLPDQVFTADHSFSCVSFTRVGDQLQQQQATTILSSMAHPNRTAEMPVVDDFLDLLNHHAYSKELLDGRKILQSPGYLEGIGDNLLDPYRGIIISGYGLRNAESSLSYLQNITGLPVYGIPTIKPFFHIDTTVSMLPNGHVLYAPEVMHPDSVAKLEDALFKGHPELKTKYATIVSEQDAYHFACNAAIVGKSVIMQDCSDTLKSTLQKKGLDVTYTTAYIANYAGGSLHCMSNTFNQPVFI